MTLLRRVATASQRLSQSLNSVCWSVGVVLLVCMLGAVGLQVISRYVFISPPAWTEEFARYCMVWAGFLGATVAYYKNADPVLATPTGLAIGQQRMMLVLQSTAAILFLLPVIYWSPVLLSHHLLRETESMKLVSAWVFSIVPIFSTVILIHSLARLLGALSGRESAIEEKHP